MANPNPKSKAPTSKAQEALQFLDDLDSFNPSPATGSNPAASSNDLTRPGSAAAAPGSSSAPPEAAEVMAFLDEITQKSAEPARPSSKLLSSTPTSRPSSRAATERVTLSGIRAKNAANAGESSRTGPPVPPAANNAGGGGGGGWGSWGGSMWSNATAAIQQAKNVVDERVVKQLPAQLPNVNVQQSMGSAGDQAQKWREGLIGYVKSAQLDKLGQDFKTASLSTLTDLLNAVAPPIAEHEVIKVWLSHDLEGYDGIETLVYRSLARILEQVEGGDLIVNKGNESRPKDNSGRRELNAVEGFETALKLAQANIEELIHADATKALEKEQQTLASSIQNPTTYSTVYLRIQPFTAPSPFPSSSPITHLQFLLHLIDPSHGDDAHNITTQTLTQAIPASWLDLWDDQGNGEWVEDQLAEVLRLGVELLGQEYLVKRMGWDLKIGGAEEERERQRDVVDEDEEGVVVNKDDLHEKQSSA